MFGMYKYVLAPVAVAVVVGYYKKVSHSLTVRELEKAVASNDKQKVESILMFKSHHLPKEMKKKVEEWFQKNS